METYFFAEDAYIKFEGISVRADYMDNICCPIMWLLKLLEIKHVPRSQLILPWKVMKNFFFLFFFTQGIELPWAGYGSGGRS